MVDWLFLFKDMLEFGNPKEFVNMTTLLFLDSLANVKVLNCMIKKGVEEGRIYGIVLPIENRQQVIAQFVDDISFTLQGKEGLIKVLLNVLQTFYFSSGLVLN
uniref:Uncharacterized protein n=1 Tax=Physcomitrium patens TaxID=3218 RepID=A0A2K1KWE9_PHYPA|nr:hypothetical protein PHYPA_005094 [Physcomitrium patens]